MRGRWQYWGVWWILGILERTLRVERVGWEVVLEIQAKTPGVVFAFFHGGLLPLALGHQGSGFGVLVSPSRDGDLVSQVLEQLGFRVVRGSSVREGVRGLLSLWRMLRQGIPVALAVDGPRGPRHRVKPGVFLLAQRAQVPIIPVGVGWSRGWILRTWDGFCIPTPFARVVIQYGEPFWMEEGEIRREWATQLEARLKDLGEEAQGRALGRRVA